MSAGMITIQSVTRKFLGNLWVRFRPRAQNRSAGEDMSFNRAGERTERLQSYLAVYIRWCARYSKSVLFLQMVFETT